MRPTGVLIPFHAQGARTMWRRTNCVLQIGSLSERAALRPPNPVLATMKVLTFNAMPSDLYGRSKIGALIPCLIVFLHCLTDRELSVMVHDRLSRRLGIDVTSAL